MAAFKTLNLETAKCLVNENPDLVHLKDENIRGFTPLHWAARSGFRAGYELAEYLLSVGSDVDARDQEGATPLHWASSCGHLDLSEHLLKAGADPNAADSAGWTALHYCARHSWSEEIARCLVEAGAEPNVRSNDGWLPLQLSYREQDFTPGHFINRLLALGAELDLLTAIAMGRNEDVSRILKADPSLAITTDPRGETPLHWACRYNRTECAELLLAAGADPLALDREGWIPIAVSRFWENDNNKATSELLLARGAEETLLSRCFDGEKPDLKSRGDVDVNRFLAELPETFQVRGDHRRFIWSVFCWYADGGCIGGDTGNLSEELRAVGDFNLNLLVSFGNNLQEVKRYVKEHPDAVDQVVNGAKPLHVALSCDAIDWANRRKIRDFLHQEMAQMDVFSATALGLDKQLPGIIKRQGIAAVNQPICDILPLQIAIRCERPETVRILLEHGADPNSLGLLLPWWDKGATDFSPLPKTHATPMHDAAMYCGKTTEVVELLLEFGATPDTRDWIGSTALLWMARADGMEKHIELLLEHGADPNAADHYGATPLHRAVQHGKTECLATLLKYGGDPSLTTWTPGGTGKALSALDVAEWGSSDEVKAQLRGD